MASGCDLLVVGGGVAGAAAAIAAADLGLDVLLVEKTDRLGGSALWSAGNLLELTGAGAMTHLRALCFDRTPDDVLAAYLAGLAAVRDRLHALGAETEPVTWLPHCWPNLPGAEAVSYYRVAGGTDAGGALAAVLERALVERGVRVATGTALSGLHLDGERVVGAATRTERGEDTVEARAGVVLATGGFEASEAMKEAYLPVPHLAVVGCPGNTGDGLVAAQQVGAAVWHMSAFFGFWAFLPPAGGGGVPLLPIGPSHLIVDPTGRRFHAEVAREAHDLLRSVGDVLPGRDAVPALPATLIMDEALLREGPLTPFPGVDRPDWSAGSRAELDRGWILSADSPAELAAAAGLDPEALTRTIAEFERAALHGGDAFGRAAATMRPLAGRLHAIRVWPGVATTSGGPRRDAQARVVRWDGSAIPGLFAAGGNGSIWGHLTHHGGGLTDGLVFGPIAATSAAAALQERTARA